MRLKVLLLGYLLGRGVGATTDCKCVSYRQILLPVLVLIN